MKTWFEWMEEYYLPQLQPNDPQPGESERILALVRQKAGLKRQPSRPRRLWVLAAAAALAVCLGTGALASGVFPWQSVGDFFGADGQQAASLGMIGEGLSLSQTKAGVTVTLEGVVDDGSVAYIPAQITFEEGQYDPSLSYSVFAVLESPNPVDRRTNGAGCRPLEDPDPADNTVPILLTASHEGLQTGDSVQLEILSIFGNTVAADGSTETTWNWEETLRFSFTLPESQPAVTVQVPADTREPQTGVPIAQVRLTPMRVEVIFGEHPEDSQVRDSLSRVFLALTFTDGTTLTLPEGWENGGERSAEGSGTGSSTFDGPYYKVTCEFDALLDPSSVTAVTVNGIKIPIS